MMGILTGVPHQVHNDEKLIKFTVIIPYRTTTRQRPE